MLLEAEMCIYRHAKIEVPQLTMSKLILCRSPILYICIKVYL